MTIMSTNDRRDLRFAEVAEVKFNLLQEHGFKRMQSEPTLVRFESRRAYVNVYHGRQSFEVGLEIGSLVAGADETSYSMSEIIRLVDAGEADGYRNYVAHSPERVAEGVQRLAMLFSRYVNAGALGDTVLFERLREGRELWSREYATDVNLTHARQKLGVLWHAKDYPKVVELLSPLRDALTPTEVHKLEYAEKHVGRI